MSNSFNHNNSRSGDSSGQFLSKKDIPVNERLIFALDVGGIEEAKDWVEKLGDEVVFYKIGWQLVTSGDYFELIKFLKQSGKKVFADLKVYDISKTVALAIEGLNKYGVDFVTIHGNRAIMEAAVSKKADVLKILAVTVLTNLDRDDLKQMGLPCLPEELVELRAGNALKSGCDGIISSGLEVKSIREKLGDKLICVTPGVRPADSGNIQSDDQKRIVTVKQAFLNGADHIVVGRPIRDAENPKLQAQKIQREIAEIFGNPPL